MRVENGLAAQSKINLKSSLYSEGLRFMRMLPDDRGTWNSDSIARE